MSGKNSELGSPLGSYSAKANVGVKSKSQKNQEYFQALEQWLNDVRSYSLSCNFFAGLPYSLISQQTNAFPHAQNLTSNVIPPLNQNIGMFVMPGPQVPQQNLEQGTEYKIPPLWKRFAAEYVDFLLLFLVRLFISFVAVDFFDFVTPGKCDFAASPLFAFEPELIIFKPCFRFIDEEGVEVLQSKNSDYDLTLNGKMASGISEIVFLEVLHRVIVCVYEGIFLYKGSNNSIGGATPGKTLMGIKVVLCYQVQQVGNDSNIVKVLPATNLGLGWALARAVLKNLILALLFPIFLPLFFNKFHRTGYDVVCHSIVVEDRFG